MALASRRSRVGPEFFSRFDGLVCGQTSGLETEMSGMLVEKTSPGLRTLIICCKSLRVLSSSLTLGMQGTLR